MASDEIMGLALWDIKGFRGTGAPLLTDLIHYSLLRPCSGYVLFMIDLEITAVTQSCTSAQTSRPSTVFYWEVGCYPKCVYFEGNCIRLNSEIPSPPVGLLED